MYYFVCLPTCIMKIKKNLGIYIYSPTSIGYEWRKSTCTDYIYIQTVYDRIYVLS